ncbi:MAG: DUF6164 family protein [Acidiferrobacterales bacterium]
MARRVYDTGGASDEEVSDILELLTANNIPHYETPAGVFGLTPGAIWVTREADYQAARRLIEDYDRSRAERVREEYAKRAVAQGRTSLSARLSNVRRQVAQNPRNVLLYIVIIIFLILIHWLFYRTIWQL